MNFISFLKEYGSLIADLGSAIGLLLSAIALIFLAIQVRQGRKTINSQEKAIKSQIEAIETETYVSINLEFLNNISKFRPHINDSKTELKDLSEEEKRAIDKYFYLSNIEFILIEKGTITKNLSDHWLKGIKSAAKLKPFVERWETVAKKFALNNNFVEYFDNAILENESTLELNRVKTKTAENIA